MWSFSCIGPCSGMSKDKGEFGDLSFPFPSSHPSSTPPASSLPLNNPISPPPSYRTPPSSPPSSPPVSPSASLSSFGALSLSKLELDNQKEQKPQRIYQTSSFRQTSSSLVTPVNPKLYHPSSPRIKSNTGFTEPPPPPSSPLLSNFEKSKTNTLHFPSLFCVMTLGFFANVEYGVIMPSVCLLSLLLSLFHFLCFFLFALLYSPFTLSPPPFYCTLSLSLLVFHQLWFLFSKFLLFLSLSLSASRWCHVPFIFDRHVSYRSFICFHLHLPSFTPFFIYLLPFTYSFFLLYLSRTLDSLFHHLFIHPLPLLTLFLFFFFFARFGSILVLWGVLKCKWVCTNKEGRERERERERKRRGGGAEERENG